MLVGTSDEWEGIYFTPAPAPKQISALATAASGDNTVLVEEVPFVSLTMTDARGTDSDGGITPQAAPNPIYRCQPWTLLSSSLVWATAGQSFSGPATNWAEVDSSHSVTTGTASSSSGSLGTWSVSGSQTHTTGNTKTFSESLEDRDFQIEIKYGKWRAYCPGAYKYAFTPSYGTGGDRTTSITGSYPSLSYCTQTSAGVWKREVSTGDAFSFSAGVKASGALGINLGITNNYSTTTNQKMILFYRPTKVAQICGDTDFPSRARKPRVSKYL